MLVSEGEKCWTDTLRDLVYMDYDKLAALAAERISGEQEYVTSIKKKTYDMNTVYEESFQHNMVVYTYVKDPTLFKTEEEIAALKFMSFASFTSKIDFAMYDEEMMIFPHGEDVCTHYEKGVSLYDDEGTNNM